MVLEGKSETLLGGYRIPTFGQELKNCLDKCRHRLEGVRNGPLQCRIRANLSSGHERLQRSELCSHELHGPGRTTDLALILRSLVPREGLARLNRTAAYIFY